MDDPLFLHRMLEVAPLPYNLVNEWRLSKSPAPLLNLSTETLGMILGYITSDSLAAIALVNHDCRQLAHSRQFASITLDFSIFSFEIVGKLFGEYKERVTHYGTTTSLSLGACIRSIVVSTDPSWLNHSHEIRRTELVVLDKNLLKRSGMSYAHYIAILQEILSERTVLPNLQLLDWLERATLPRSCFAAMACSSIQHLRLHQVVIDKEFKSDLPVAVAAGGWRLKTLDLDIYPKPGTLEKAKISQSAIAYYAFVL